MAHLFDRLYNLHWVTPEVARAAQPYLGFYRTFLNAHGFRAIINLRGENPSHFWWRQEKRAADALGIAHFDVRLSSRLLPARKSLVDLADAFARAPRPLLIKCSGGQDRTSFAAAAYLLIDGGPGATEAAERQYRFWPYFHLPKQRQKWMRYFPSFVKEHLGSCTVEEWLRTGYDPEDFASWLDQMGQPATYLALQKA